MTISALCIFSGNMPKSDPDATAEALRAAGYQVFRLPPELKAATCEEGHDFIEIHREGDADDDDAIEAMRTDAWRIVGPFEGEVDCVGAASEELFLELTGALDTRPSCAHCGYRETPDRPLLSIFGHRRPWLHDDCLRPRLDTLVEAGPRLDTLVDPEEELITQIEAELDTPVEEEF